MALAFDAVGKKIFYLDDVGGGAKMKLVVNMIMGMYFNNTTGKHKRRWTSWVEHEVNLVIS